MGRKSFGSRYGYVTFGLPDHAGAGDWGGAEGGAGFSSDCFRVGHFGC